MNAKNTELKVEYVNIGELKPYENNAKEHPDWQIDQIVKSIEEFGNCDPIGVWTNESGELEIVEGHGRLAALQKLDIESVPVIHLDHLNDEQRRAYGLVHNQTTMSSGWNDSKLQAELDSMVSIDMGDFGFDDGFFDNRGSKSQGSPKYSQRIETPIYEPKGDNPDISELYDVSTYEKLISSIDNNQDISDEQKVFLTFAAARHISFSFGKIAEYYAHADENMRSLMEDNSLVIIDYNKAIELGCIRASSAFDELMGGGDVVE